MTIAMPKYDEKKATQLAAFLLKQNKGKMSFLKFMKIMTNIEREALVRWTYPITHDSFCSMKKGQVLSETYNRMKQNCDSYWNTYLETSSGREILKLKKVCPTGKLSKAEMSLVKEVFNRDIRKTIDELVEEHHQYPEYVNPGNSSIPTDYETLLKKLGKNREQITGFKKEMCGAARLEEIVQ